VWQGKELQEVKEMGETENRKLKMEKWRAGQREWREPDGRLGGVEAEESQSILTGN